MPLGALLKFRVQPHRVSLVDFEWRKALSDDPASEESDAQNYHSYDLHDSVSSFYELTRFFSRKNKKNEWNSDDVFEVHSELGDYRRSDKILYFSEALYTRRESPNIKILFFDVCIYTHEHMPV